MAFAGGKTVHNETEKPFFLRKESENFLTVFVVEGTQDDPFSSFFFHVLEHLGFVPPDGEAQRCAKSGLYTVSRAKLRKLWQLS